MLTSGIYGKFCGFLSCLFDSLRLFNPSLAFIATLTPNVAYNVMLRDLRVSIKLSFVTVYMGQRKVSVIISLFSFSFRLYYHANQFIFPLLGTAAMKR